ncbi:hypothetical protein [Solihabitans fulvus]|uniref:hypothetical protein n=1 Tax=Solihabitans fulvus TaxID=1892852 RepID=UPI001CB766D3|nr:hypothetical protein [Solihabitans fulvus]
MTWFSRKRRTGRAAEPVAAPAQVPVHLPNPAEAAEEFWRRWFDLLPTISGALGDGEPGRVENELCELVAAVHPDLHFSLERGRRAIYALVLSGQEDPRLRPYTDAWIAAAPQEDMIWEYHDSVPAVPDPTGVTVNLGAHRLALADFRVVAQVDEEAGVVDVAVHHPELANLAEAARQAMTFLPLDATLGERLAGERLRRVETADAEPAGTISLLELRAIVRGLAGVEDEPWGYPDRDSAQEPDRDPGQDPSPEGRTDPPKGH